MIDQSPVHAIIAEDHAVEIYAPESDAYQSGFDLYAWCVSAAQLLAKVINIEKFTRNHSSQQPAAPMVIAATSDSG
ncbi:hypothetical protein [Caulobacter sp. LjRoot300]|uniref:hypothetical protein n=1 Tax=Caulobacter sp. LjRoot300 TaxID=3342321 RepID=UPI003ECCEBD1